jgi:hypothetical protein
MSDKIDKDCCKCEESYCSENVKKRVGDLIYVKTKIFAICGGR